MPEHVHLLVSEPERSKLAGALQIKQIVARKMKRTLWPRVGEEVGRKAR